MPWAASVERAPSLKPLCQASLNRRSFQSPESMLCALSEICSSVSGWRGAAFFLRSLSSVRISTAASPFARRISTLSSSVSPTHGVLAALFYKDGQQVISADHTLVFCTHRLCDIRGTGLPAVLAAHRHYVTGPRPART